MMPQVENGAYVPLIVAAGGGGRGYSSQSDTQEEQMDFDPGHPGRNGKSNAAGDVPEGHPIIVCLFVSVGERAGNRARGKEISRRMAGTVRNVLINHTEEALYRIT